MPKLKTHQATAKRYKRTSSGKIKRRVAGQSHFNSREPGKVGRQKRKSEITSPALNRIIQITLPN
jgi:large subunit ribosomal protein L35